jgi:hypothetical protein
MVVVVVVVVRRGGVLSGGAAVRVKDRLEAYVGTLISPIACA